MTSHQVPAGSVGGAPFAAMLRTAFLPSVLCGVAAVVVFWVSKGATSGLAALGGVLVAVIFFAAGLIVMKRVVNDNPLSLVAAALAVFLGQVIFLGVVILSLARASWLDGVAFGIAILVVALAWQVFQVVAFVKRRTPVYDSSPLHGGSPGAPGPGE